MHDYKSYIRRPIAARISATLLDTQTHRHSFWSVIH